MLVINDFDVLLKIYFNDYQIIIQDAIISVLHFVQIELKQQTASPSIEI